MSAVAKTVAAFFEKPAGSGPWPTVVLLHGHQEPPSAGGRVFAERGVLKKLAQRGYLAVAVSQPGYGNSSGPPDFCGPFTRHGVSGVISKLRSDGLIAAHDRSVTGVVLVSGLYDIPEFAANPKSDQARQVLKSLADETGGAPDALRARSVLYFARDIQASVLILNGALDDRTDPGQARRLAEAITANGGKARAIIYPNYGHQVPVEVRDKEIDPFIDGVLAK